MNENINDNFNLNTKELNDKQIQDKQDTTSCVEIDARKLLLKIRKAQMELAATNSELEESKKNVGTISEYERGRLEQRLDEIHALLLFGRAKVAEREKNGEVINPEERNIAILKEGLEFATEEARKQQRGEVSQSRIQQMENFFNGSRDTINELNTHIRK